MTNVFTYDYEKSVIKTLENLLPTYNEDAVMNGYDDELTDAIEVAIGCIMQCLNYERYLSRCIEAVGHCLEQAKLNGDPLAEGYFFLELEKYKKQRNEFETVGGEDD